MKKEYTEVLMHGVHDDGIKCLESSWPVKKRPKDYQLMSVVT